MPQEARGILRRVGKWYKAARESFSEAEPVSHLTSNRDMLLTRKGNALYVHLCRDPVSEALKLKPIGALLNTGKSIQWSVDMVPSEHVAQGLRLVNLPVNELTNTVMVVRLDFENPCGTVRSCLRCLRCGLVERVHTGAAREHSVR